MNPISWIISALAGNAGATAGRVVANVGFIAALTPAAIWLIAHKQEVAVSFTYGQLAIFGVVLAVILKIVHWSRPPTP